MAIFSTISHAEATAADGEQRNAPKPRGHPHNKGTYRDNLPQGETPTVDEQSTGPGSLPANTARGERAALADEVVPEEEFRKLKRNQKESSS
ncbi:hypothetical protein FS837_003137 [Tulasnella sp. UAMH 9824]|nr:hypothetical protein FS837_003137 [Tulasnella sp. UAMH 9824]